ncbi:hypothetical protein RFY44_03445 [Acinetobacter bereziniae]|uniref:hypothetical protein n=1 Tax=Acinetobacter bereziniae TaxID=106648 RepID=UPI0028139C30|nr:hypothetical protein [Acinetobacter bereziniae]MDQ9817931.1 hypothetical protein [Acinetobacter bereziniae]
MGIIILKKIKIVINGENIIMTIDHAPYPNSKGEDINTPAINKLPKVQPPDFSKIQGHTCTKIPAFNERQKRFESLSGSYYRTKADGSYEGVVEYDPEESYTDKLKIVEQDGKQKVVPFYNYGERSKNIDIEFDSKKNVLIFSRKLIFILKKVINSDNGKEYPYESQKSTQKPYQIQDREITQETMQFIQDRQDKVNELLNYAGYYLTPTDCNIEGGCTCVVPIIMKVTMQVQQASEPQNLIAHYINLYPSASRADESNWGEVELKNEKFTKHGETKVINGNVISSPSILVQEERTQDSTAVFLHETAHLFGFPDEYFEGGGAVHKMYIHADTQTVDIHFLEPKDDWKRQVDGQLMSSAVPGTMPVIPPYYYEQFRQYFEKKTGVRWTIKKLVN